jgi:Rps23 Pro-64 3,4-dihydroxylase Tpa1-like proline 4-hydroxylase
MSIFNASPLRSSNSYTLLNFDVNDQNKNAYQNASPYPHIVIDNFIKDTKMLDDIVSEYKNYNYWGYDPTEYARQHQVNKYFSPWCDENTKDLPHFTKKLMDHLNSSVVIKQIENITGISDLIPDLGIYGASMNKIDVGGKLDLHIDSNKHYCKSLFRRVNLILYLNKDWQETWGSELQLWNNELNRLEKSISPIYNRAVIFNTTPKSFHGHPTILTCPNGVSRYSMSVYYFTKDRPNHEKDNTSFSVWKDDIK